MSAAESGKRYQALAVNTAPPGHLVLMLFDGALRFMDQAAAGSIAGNPAEQTDAVQSNLIKAQRILCELQTSLDLVRGGKFSVRMSALYDYMRGLLRDAQLKKDPEPIRLAARLLGQIRDAWAQMLTQSSNATA